MALLSVFVSDFATNSQLINGSRPNCCPTSNNIKIHQIVSAKKKKFKRLKISYKLHFYGIQKKKINNKNVAGQIFISLRIRSNVCRDSHFFFSSIKKLIQMILWGDFFFAISSHAWFVGCWFRIAPIFNHENSNQMICNARAIHAFFFLFRFLCVRKIN